MGIETHERVLSKRVISIVVLAFICAIGMTVAFNAAASDRSASVRDLCSPNPAKSEPCAECKGNPSGTPLDTKTQAELRKIKAGILKEKMNHLFSRYGTEKARTSDPSGYLKAVEAVLAETETGTKVLECFRRPPNQERFVEPPEFRWTKNRAGFINEPDPKHPEKMRRIVRLPSGWSVRFFLLAFLHELKHACAAEEFENTRSVSAFRALDEFRAYATQVSFFKELAQADPKAVCGLEFSSDLFKKKLTSAEYHASLEELMNKGEFVEFWANAYREVIFSPEEIFVMGEGSQPLLKSGRKIVREELASQIETQTGFPANPRGARPF